MLYFPIFFMLTFPTSEGKISANCFGSPKTFRAPQNTTCYVRLNIKIRLEKQVNFVRILSIAKSY